MKGFELTIVARIDAPTMDDARFATAKVCRQLDNYRDTNGVLFTDVGYDVRYFTLADQIRDRMGETTLIEGGSHELAERTDDDHPQLPAAGSEGVGGTEAD